MDEDTFPYGYFAHMTINDFKADLHAAKFVVELDTRPQASEHLFRLLNDPANEQRLVDAEATGMPALAGVARLIEEDPAIATVLETGPAALRFRQAIGMAVKLKMAKLGWRGTGTKGAVRGSCYFTKAERYAHEPLSSAERTARKLAALDAIYEMHDGQEQDDPEYDLMEALAENRRAEGRVF
ncbi:hypothetical protein [Candidatus Poriferisocius sp.]|uniref:hypothetical protein n=1 Tax=Candidatus Poriferisocius sp. TaxID=3101276 RepID=UPI003B02198C